MEFFQSKGKGGWNWQGHYTFTLRASQLTSKQKVGMKTSCVQLLRSKIKNDAKRVNYSWGTDMLHLAKLNQIIGTEIYN